MMRVTYLAHSGFLVELDTVCLLFDWWKGTLPPLPDKALTVFASHRHADHFNPEIFRLDDGARDVRFVLGKDIKLSAHNLEKWGVSSQTAEKCVRAGRNEAISLPGAEILALPSTDSGAAFWVRADGRSVYHAGDLNWWHWDGDTLAERRNMEANFKRYLEPLRGQTLDLAFAPLDPRLEQAADRGFLYLLELADVRRIFPMHQWDDNRVTAAFLAKHTEFSRQVIPVAQPGQCWEFD
jgi:L-ascorbate metabolism protein UlaG (beta-lactamase superfamily)